jgi:hypothetical protein
LDGKKKGLMRDNRFIISVASVLAICWATCAAWAGEVEFLRWWNSGGESGAG